MKTYLECWISAAEMLFSQALAGEPQLAEMESLPSALSGPAFLAEFSGDVRGQFTVLLDPEIMKLPLLGDGVDQSAAWNELLREVADAAAGELLASSGLTCRIEAFHPVQLVSACTRGFRLISPGASWAILICDETKSVKEDHAPMQVSGNGTAADARAEISPGVELLLDVELEAALRFGCCEMPLGEILELGPGDVVELDRHVSEPVDLVVGDKIVARGEVVLVNGNFGLRVTDVATPQRRLESIRCLF
ncbi:MAG: flagellar motor switch protein FliN [Terracidiphilus sp.]